MLCLPSETEKHLKVMCFLLCLPSEAEEHLKVTVCPAFRCFFIIYRSALWSKPTARARSRARGDRYGKQEKLEKRLLLSALQLQTVHKVGKAVTFKCVSPSEGK